MKVEYSDDRHLVAALAAGEEEAYGYVFDKFYASLVDYAWRILRDADQAQDVVQSSFMKLYEMRQNLPVDAMPKSYLYRMVYTACVSALRHRKVVKEYADHKLLDYYFNEIVQTPDAEMKLHDKEIRKYVDEAVASLTGRCKEVYELKCSTDFTNQQIAEKLGVSKKTVEAQYTKALAKLRQDLEWLFVLMAVYKVL